jgi:hypothetical protein
MLLIVSASAATFALRLHRELLLEVAVSDRGDHLDDAADLFR